jgi:hypothetical protein
MPGRQTTRKAPPDRGLSQAAKFHGLRLSGAARFVWGIKARQSGLFRASVPPECRKNRYLLCFLRYEPLHIARNAVESGLSLIREKGTPMATKAAAKKTETDSTRQLAVQ